MIHPAIGLTDDACKQVSQKLSYLLCNEFIIYIKTLKFHWNVTGSDFKPLHLFFEEQYEELLQIVDDVAERIRSLGYFSPGTATEFLKNAELTEAVGENPPAAAMLTLLLHDHEAIIRIIRKEIDATTALGDAGTNNFLCDLMERHEKMAWMLRAFQG